MRGGFGNRDSAVPSRPNGYLGPRHTFTFIHYVQSYNHTGYHMTLHDGAALKREASRGSGTASLS